MCTSAFILSFYVNFQVDMLYNVFKHSFFSTTVTTVIFFLVFFYTQRFNFTHFVLLWIWKKTRCDMIHFYFNSLVWLFRFFMHLNFRSIICWRLYDYLWGTLRLSIRNFGITCNFNNHLKQYSDITITNISCAILQIDFHFAWDCKFFFEFTGILLNSSLWKMYKKNPATTKTKCVKTVTCIRILQYAICVERMGLAFFLVLEIFFLLLFVYQSHFLSFALTHTATLIRNFSQFLHKSKRYSSFSSQTKIQ